MTEGFADIEAVLATIAVGLFGSCFGCLFALTRPPDPLARWVLLFRWMAGPAVCTFAGTMMLSCLKGAPLDSYAWVFPTDPPPIRWTG